MKNKHRSYLTKMNRSSSRVDLSFEIEFFFSFLIYFKDDNAKFSLKKREGERKIMALF